jgi:hypothetical protein
MAEKNAASGTAVASLWSVKLLRFKMSQQIHTAAQKVKHKKEARSAPSFKNLARQYFDLQRLRKEVRIAECGKTTGQEWLLHNHRTAADWSATGARRPGYPSVHH